jgi:hypothetical protein
LQAGGPLSEPSGKPPSEELPSEELPPEELPPEELPPEELPPEELPPDEPPPPVDPSGPNLTDCCDEQALAVDSVTKVAKAGATLRRLRIRVTIRRLISCCCRRNMRAPP